MNFTQEQVPCESITELALVDVLGSVTRKQVLGFRRVRLLASSVCVPSVCLHGRKRLPLDGFRRNLVHELSSKIH